MTILPRAIHVINLDGATARMDAVVRSYDTHLGDSGIALDRFIAVDAAAAGQQAIPGRLSWKEKACFLSHARCLQAAAARGGDAPLWVVEDDVVFGTGTRARLGAALEVLQDKEWDILLTDVCATEPRGASELYGLWRKVARAGSTAVVDLSRMAFIGTASYLVNPKSVARLLDLLEQCRQLDMAFDIWIKWLAGTGTARCLCVLPFATSVADAPTQIQPEATRTHMGWWSAFRQLLWEGTDRDVLDRRIEALGAGFTDPDAARAGRILAGMLSDAWASRPGPG